MARSIKDIQADILTAFANDSTLSGLTSTSVTAIYRLQSFIVAATIWALEVLFDAHVTEVQNIITAQKPHTLYWYVAKAKAFQFGSALPDGADEYDNSSLTDAQIASEKIVYAAAAVELNGRLLVKAAKLIGANLVKLTLTEYNTLFSYLNEIKDAGVRIDLISTDADRFKLRLDIFYDAQILDSTGARLDGSSATPVSDAVNTFIKNVPFNGIFVKSKLVDALQNVSGVIVPEIRDCQAARSDVVNWQAVDVFYQPYSGYLSFYNPNDLVINYILV